MIGNIQSIIMLLLSVINVSLFLSVTLFDILKIEFYFRFVSMQKGMISIGNGKAPKRVTTFDSSTIMISFFRGGGYNFLNEVMHYRLL